MFDLKLCMPRVRPVRRPINENRLAYRQRSRNRNPQEAVEVNENINRRRRRRQGQEQPQEHAMNRNTFDNNIYSKYNHRYNKSTRYKIPFQQYESCKMFSDNFCSNTVLRQSKPVQSL